MSRELVTPGSPITWAFLDRSFGGRAVELLKVSDGRDGNVAGTATWSNAHNFTAGLTKAGAPVLAGSPFLVAQVTGLASAGSIVLAGAKVGDKVLSVIDQTAAPSVLENANFESTISVAGHIQQLSGAGDIHLKTAIMVTLVKQS
jgi:hypothetical protein